MDNKFTGITNFSSMYRHMSGHDVATNEYILKPKLHGTNASVRFEYSDGQLVAWHPCSKNRELTVGDDHMGWAMFCSGNSLELGNIAGQADRHFNTDDNPQEIQIYGEWAGEGIQKGTSDAVCGIEGKHFFIFAIRIDHSMISDLTFLKPKTRTHNIHIIPELGRMDLNLNVFEPIDDFTDKVNAEVGLMENADAYIYKLFGVEGTGEGLVGTRSDVMPMSTYFENAFKAKTSAHAVKTQSKPAHIEPLPQDLIAFATAYVTGPRMDQAISEISMDMSVDRMSMDMRNTPLILSWMAKDIIKEGEDELVEMGYEWKKVAKTVNALVIKMWKERVNENKDI
jgi:hypothetical protein